MAPESRVEDATLIQRSLYDAPHRFAFFQAVRLLEEVYPERKRVGDYVDPGDEVARFSVEPFISFPASEIQEIGANPDGPVRLAVNFMGLVGPQGVLPYYYTLLVAERVRARDRALKEFLDIFHHRLISLFYRAWERSQLTISGPGDDSDRITAHLFDLLGIGLENYQGQTCVRDETLAFYAGLLGPQQRSAVALQQLLEDYFDLPIAVEQFVGGWYSLSEGSRCSIGEDTASEGLGSGAVLGDEIWDQQSRVRIRIGPLARAQYDEFLPDGTAHEELRALTRFFADDEFEFEVQLVLAGEEVPACVIGEAGDETGSLGLSTWMRTSPFTRDAGDTVLKL